MVDSAAANFKSSELIKLNKLAAAESTNPYQAKSWQNSSQFWLIIIYI